MTQTPGSSDPSHGRSAVDPAAAAAAPPPPYGAYPVYTAPPPPPKKTSLFTRILLGIFVSLFFFSLMANVYMTQIVATFMSGPHEESYQPGGQPDQRIVIVPVEGVIDDSTAVFVRKAFDAIRGKKDKMPKAIVLRVDSPGGYVGASDRIYHQVVRFKSDHPQIPVVVSMGSVAASGGYYVSAPGDYIFAEPTSITGSIGVIMQGMTFEGLMEKLGITPQVIVADSSPRKDIANNPMRAWGDEDVAKVKQILNAAHARFIDVVADGRKAMLSSEEVKPLCNGDVYTAGQAVENKLVDAEGYLEDAIAEAGKRAGIKGEPQVTIIRKPRGFSLMNLLAESKQSSLPQNGKELAAWLRDATEATIEYRWSPGR